MVVEDLKYSSIGENTLWISQVLLRFISSHVYAMPITSALQGSVVIDFESLFRFRTALKFSISRTVNVFRCPVVSVNNDN